jgi:hypothetical protein
MFDRSFARRRMATGLVSACLVASWCLPVNAQSPSPAPVPAASAAPAKKVVQSANDLPRFTYPIDTSASALLQSDPATFNAFAAKVKADIDDMLAAYDIEDHATLRGLLSTELSIDLLAGAAPATVSPLLERIRDLHDKPDAKALSGIFSRAILAAQADTGNTSGAAFEASFRQHYAALLAPLPWAVVGTTLKESKTTFDIITPALLIGQVQGDLDPAVAKTHALSSESAAGLIGTRYALDDVIPLRAQASAVIASEIAQNTAAPKPDIWTAREVTLTAAQHLTPVRIAIWDSGVDVTLFPKQLYTDPNPKARTPHGFAFDLASLPTTGVLYPLTPAEKKLYPTFVGYFKGLSDLDSAISSPDADAVKAKIASLPPADVPAFFQTLSLMGDYAHGTHVAGLAVRGNPAARIVVGRITYDHKTIPTPPTDQLMRQDAASEYAAVAYFRAHQVRVVNMSWGDDPSSFESALEKNGIGRNATERKALARKYFLVERNALYDAIKRAPDILFVCSAGNSNASADFDETIPAGFALPNLLVVGAVDQAGDETSFTSYGKTVAVDADGYQVPSTVPGGAIVQLSGTSMSSPNTANLAAKLLALDPKLTPTQVIALIEKGATASSDGRRKLIDPQASVALLAAMMHPATAH